jgi:hypothetical protein
MKSVSANPRRMIANAATRVKEKALRRGLQQVDDPTHDSIVEFSLKALCPVDRFPLIVNRSVGVGVFQFHKQPFPSRA